MGRTGRVPDFSDAHPQATHGRGGHAAAPLWSDNHIHPPMIHELCDALQSFRTSGTVEACNAVDASVGTSASCSNCWFSPQLRCDAPELLQRLLQAHHDLRGDFVRRR